MPIAMEHQKTMDLENEVVLVRTRPEVPNAVIVPSKVTGRNKREPSKRPSRIPLRKSPTKNITTVKVTPPRKQIQYSVVSLIHLFTQSGLL